jgi:hypothetical protein
VITGAEYLDIVSDDPLILWGVEHPHLYRENQRAYVQAMAVRDQVRALLAPARQAIEALRPVLSRPELLVLEARERAFEERTLELGAYAVWLHEHGARKDLTSGAFPQFERFLRLHEVEETLASKRLSRKEAEAAQRLSEELSLQINAQELSGELDRLVAVLRRRLASSPELRRLLELDEQLTLLEKLADLQLTSEDHQRFSRLDLGALSEWPAFLNGQLVTHGLRAVPLSGLAQARRAVWPMQRFYEIARERDVAMVRNTLDKVRETGEPVAVLITGGFHGPRMTRLLQEEGVDVMAVAPQVAHPTDERLYQTVLRFKRGEAGFEEVQALRRLPAGSSQGLGNE